jgi:prepilin-type N-terminal cleavage/methylation domain-containing protein
MRIRRSNHEPPALGRAFTLIELMLVMALLVIVVGISFPSLQHFFRGRTLDSEARRFLSLARYGQSRAVSEGVPMVLWVDARERSYGLQAEAGWLDNDAKAVQFDVDDGLDVQVVASLPASALVGNGRDRGRTTQSASTLPALRFWPDGSLVETSPEYVEFRENQPGQNAAVWVAQTPNRLSYEIRSAQPFVTRR